jgi:hypothetical protein
MVLHVIKYQLLIKGYETLLTEHTIFYSTGGKVTVHCQNCVSCQNIS